MEKEAWEALASQPSKLWGDTNVSDILDPSMSIETPSDQPNGDDVEERGHILDGKY